MLHKSITERLKLACEAVLATDAPIQIQVQACPDPRFGDYQTNSLIQVAKQLRLNPRSLASDVVSKINLTDLCSEVTVAGPGFINFKLHPTALTDALIHLRTRLALSNSFASATPGPSPKRFLVDFSSPNIAKPMHVGHIRSTILGDSICKILRFLGHEVISDNHLGDWGTQFGKLIVGWKKHLDSNALERDPMAEMERLYKLINQECEADVAVLDEARSELKKLQDGDPSNLKIWNDMVKWSFKEFDEVYGRLGIKFDHTLGESFYNTMLKSVVDDLVTRNIATESQGAKVVLFADDDLKSNPAIIQKSDGAANYTTTDLATVAYRIKTWAPHEIIYVTDGRQQLHFKQLFRICAQWIPNPSPQFKHVWFGSILGSDGKPFKTRSGETVRLAALLDEAELRAFEVVDKKNPDLPEIEKREIARVVGIGAIKYADLLQNRQSDYVFDWDKMLSFNGNTAPYLQYAYARIKSIFRRATELECSTTTTLTLVCLKEEDELSLAKLLVNFEMTVEASAQDFRPNYLCSYLFEVACDFARFYETCPVLKSEGDERALRLELCNLTATVLQTGLRLLGIETVERM